MVDGVARGIITRDMVTGEIESHAADVVVLATGGYSNVFYLSTNARGCNATAIWRAYKKGAAFANPCYTQIHPTCIPQSGDYQSKLTLMSESLRNDGRVWVPQGGWRHAAAGSDSREPSATISWSANTRASATWRRATSPRAPPRKCATRAVVSGRAAAACFSISATPSSDWAWTRFASATATCSRCTSASPARTRTTCPMRIYPAPHYTMGGLWVDYNLMSTIPGLFVGGEANFSDHGANRLGASALMQGCADGYFVLPVHDRRLPGRMHAEARST